MATQRSTHGSKSKSPSKAKSKPAVKAAPAKTKAAATPKRTSLGNERSTKDRRDDERRTDARPSESDRRAAERREKPAGAHATGPADFVITRKWTGKALDSHVGAHVRVELPESTLRGMSWQLQKLPHGVELSSANVESLAKPDANLHNQNRVFDFAVTEEGEYLLQFSLQLPFDARGVADTFKVKLNANKN